MKKALLLSSIVFGFTGLGIIPPAVPVRAEMPVVISQVGQNLPNSTNSVQSQVELINPGNEPRQLLRFQPASNARQTTLLTMSMNMSGSMNGEAMPTMDFPTMKITLEAITKPLANGDIQIDLAYSKVDIGTDTTMPPEVIEAMRSQIKMLTGVKFSYVIDNQGRTKDVNVTLPKELDPNFQQIVDQMLNSLEQLSISPFPEAPVGVGAKWQISSSLALMGLPANELKMVYELVNVQDDQVTLNVSMGMPGGSSTSTAMPIPGLPSGIELAIKSMDIQSTGRLILGLNQIMPVSGQMSTMSNMEMSITDPNTNKPINMQIRSTVDMTMDSQ